MGPTTGDDLAALLKDLRAEVRSLADRLAALERHTPGAVASATPDTDALAALPAEPAALPATPAPAAQPEASEEDMLVIAAAVAAFVGVRARIRQVRLIQSTAWAQVGRATVHASHRVH